MAAGSNPGSGSQPSISGAPWKSISRVQTSEEAPPVQPANSRQAFKAESAAATALPCSQSAALWVASEPGRFGVELD